MDIKNFDNYINKKDLVLNTEINKRINKILSLSLDKKDYNKFKTLVKGYKWEELKEEFEDRIKFNIEAFSSNTNKHTVEVDGVKYCVVGNKDQFESQFKCLKRKKRIKKLLDE